MKSSVLAAIIFVGAAGGAWAADISAARPVKAPVSAPAQYNWTGFYIGANAGYGSAQQSLTASLGGFTGSGSQDLKGPIAGALVGFNFQSGMFVGGIEADYQWSDQKITDGGFTDRISDLMAISDLFITKSGSVSFCEGLYMNLPMILDATITPLAWEQANHRFIIRHELGDLLKNYQDLSGMVDKLLFDKNQLQLYKQNLITLQKKHGGNEIKRLIHQMLNF